MKAKPIWKKAVQDNLKVEGVKSPIYSCSISAQKVMESLQKTYPIRTEIRPSAQYIKTVLNSGLKIPGNPTPPGTSKVYEYELGKLMDQKQTPDVVYLILVPDHHVVFVKENGVWIMLNSWLEKFGLDFWSSVDHQAMVKDLGLNPGQRFQNWRAFAIAVYGYMITYAKNNEIPGYDNKQLAKALQKAAGQFNNELNILYFQYLKESTKPKATL